MFKPVYLSLIAIIFLQMVASLNNSLFSQTVLINHNFQTNSLPAGVTSNGTISATKAADGVCSKGMIQVNNGGQYLQVDAPSCGLLTANMKSTSTSVRTVNLRYKKFGDTAFVTASPQLSVGTAASFNLTALYPVLLTTAPIEIRLEPVSGNIQVHDLYMEASAGLNNAAEITAFKLPGQASTEIINASTATIELNVPIGTDLSSVAPSIVTTSYNATVSPATTVARDFTSPVTYTVTSESGTTTKVWTVTVGFAASSGKDITAFKLAANQIGNAVINASAGTVVINMPNTADVSNITPMQFGVSSFATVTPGVSTAQNFNSLVTYVITAQDNSTKTWTVTVNKVAAMYALNTTVQGLGKIILNPPGGIYAANTVVTVTAQSIMGSTFLGWTPAAIGTSPVASITVMSDTTVKASFSNNHNFDFSTVKGFASSAGDGFNAATTGGGCTTDTVFINGPAEFNKLCESLYYRQQAYKKNMIVGGMKKAPLILYLRSGTYDGLQTLSTDGQKAFGNSMLDIAEQGDLTFLGDTNVVFKVGVNVKRAWNVIIRNITFYDYYDDGVNIGYPETHHIWVDHCTFGHPTALPANSEHPDGGCDVKDGASYVSISWCLFRNSWKTSLVGHSDNNGGTDSGRLKVTYYNNYFLGTNSRNPRVRFGEVHFLNNLSENVMLYGIAAANAAWVYAENNFYLNTDWPMYADRSVTDFKAVYGNNSDDIFTSKTGNYPAKGLKQTGNAYDDSGLPVITAQINPAMLNPGGRSIKFDELNPTLVFNPSTYYNYTPMSAEDVRQVVPMFAGADKLRVAGCAAVLPLDFTSLTAQLMPGGKEAKIKWLVANVVNASRFEVERSSNGLEFTKLATVKVSTLSVNYEYIDHSVMPANNFYRIKVVDNDGSFTYSKTVQVKMANESTLKLYPNPASKELQICHNGTSSNATITVLTIDGRVLSSIAVQKGAVTTGVDISSLAAGTYLVRYTDGAQVAVSKFAKL